MNRFYEVFGRRPVVLPVIHVVSERLALESVLVAQEAGSDGVFLINHRMPSQEFLAIYESVAGKVPGFWIGINCLDLSAEEIFNEIFRRRWFKLSGLWVDNPMVDERSGSTFVAEKINSLRRRSEWRSLYFGGVAFKYQRPVLELERAAMLAASYMDVITTSGPGTGLAAEVEKIRRMKAAIEDKPLAIASGITPENVKDYLGIANCFLVATGISRDFVTLDPDRLKSLMANIAR